MYIHTWKPSKNHNRGKGSWWCGLYRHNDDDTAHLPRSHALAAFVTCKFVKTYKYLGIKLLSTSAPSTITTVSQSYTLFSKFGGGAYSQSVWTLFARLWYILWCYPTSLGRIERRKDRKGLRELLLPCGGPPREPGRVSLHSPQSSSIVLSAALHDTPGAGCGDCGTHTSHMTQSGWRETQESGSYPFPILLFTITLIREKYSERTVVCLNRILGCQYALQTTTTLLWYRIIRPAAIMHNFWNNRPVLESGIMLE